jgi:PEP-CTERM motif-containing protein
MRKLMTQTLLKRVAFVLPVTLVGLFASANAYGNVILDSTLLNSGFEANPDAASCPTSWTCSGSPTPGFTSYVVTSAQYTAGSDGLGSGIVPGGIAAASSPTFIEGSGTLSQTLSQFYAPSTTYQIDLWVGTPLVELDGSTPTKGPVGTIRATFLGAGGVQLQDAGSNQVGVTNITAPARGQWQLFQLTFNDSTVANVNLSTTDIEFSLFVDSTSANGSNDQIANFDIASVPEPASLGLLGLGLIGLGVARRKLRR